MSELLTKFSTTLRRIEVIAGPLDSDAADEFVWTISARPFPDETVGLWGYMRRASSEGLGQVQVLGFLTDRSWAALNESAETRQAFRDWANRYGAEVLFDTARRALQVQAALMDFAFDIDPQAPVTKVEIRGADEDSSEGE